MLDLNKLENVKEDGRGWIAGCPACVLNGQDHSKDHLRIFKDTKKFSCVVFPSDENHNSLIFSLAKGLQDFDEEYEYTIEDKLEIEKIYDESYIGKLVKNYTYWNNRDISDSTLEVFECGVATTGQMMNRFTFGMRNINEQLIGFCGRTLVNSEMKYKHIGSKNRFIFPKKSISTPAIKKAEYVVLVEGIGCVLKNFECGYSNTICIFGVSLSQFVLQYLIALNPKYIIISTNLDEKNKDETKSEVGQKGAEKIRRKLCKFFDEDKVIKNFPTKKDFPEMSREEVKLWHENLVKIL